MGKEYKVTYKTYYNDRLKKTVFHNKLVHPLYIQVTFDRKSIFFKSFFFDLFSKPKYAGRVGGEALAPDIKGIIEKEEKLIEFIVKKNLENFSLDLFKSDYAYYGRDLLDMMEPIFLNYLYTFLYDEGLPYLAETVRLGSGNCKLYDLVRDFRKCLNSKLYQALWVNSFSFSPPYLPLWAFNDKPQPTLLNSFTVMDWDLPGTQERFIKFFKKSYPDVDFEPVIKEINKWFSKNVS